MFFQLLRVLFLIQVFLMGLKCNRSTLLVAGVASAPGVRSNTRSQN